MLNIPKVDFPKTTDIAIEELVNRLKGREGSSHRIGDSMYREEYVKELLNQLKNRDKSDIAELATGENYPLRIRTLGGENYNEAGDYQNQNVLSSFIAPSVVADDGYELYRDLME